MAKATNNKTVGSRDIAHGAVKHLGVWKNIVDVKIFGIIDRDFDDHAYLNSIEVDRCHVLAYHEAESYLCHPDLLAESSQRSGYNVPRQSSQDEPIKQCTRLMISAALHRTFAKSKIILQVGKEDIGEWPKDKETAEASLQRWAVKESGRGRDLATTVLSNFTNELALCKKAVESSNVDEMLAIFPGKELLGPLSSLAGFRRPSMLLSSAIAGFKPSSFAPLLKIGEAARTKLG
jgi:hypothetical protein